MEFWMEMYVGSDSMISCARKERGLACLEDMHIVWAKARGVANSR